MISRDTPIGTKVSHPDFGVGVITEMFTTTAEIDCGGNKFCERHEHLTIIRGDIKEYLQDEIANLETDMLDTGAQINNLELRFQYIKGRLEANKATLAHLLAAN